MSKQSVSRKVSSTAAQKSVSARRIASLELKVARLEREKRETECLLELSRAMTSARLRLAGLALPGKTVRRPRKRVRKVAQKQVHKAPILRLVPMPVEPTEGEG